jgi:hypothetical protein
LPGFLEIFTECLSLDRAKTAAITLNQGGENTDSSVKIGKWDRFQPDLDRGDSDHSQQEFWITSLVANSAEDKQ